MHAIRTSQSSEYETQALARLSEAFRPGSRASASVWHLDAGICEALAARAYAVACPARQPPYFVAGNRALMKSTIRPAAGGSKLLNATTT